MAVFFVNKCTYPDCRKKYPTLSELIYHIEDEHIDFSPTAIEEKERQKNQCLPLSYVLKYSQFCYRTPEFKDTTFKVAGPLKIESDYVLPEHDSLLIESEISDDSWIDDFCTDYPNYTREEPMCRTKKFVCPVPGCNKRYKNINGIKYHTKNGHEIKKSPVKLKKMHKCHCGKSYKTAQGLKAHSASHKELNVNVYKTASSSSSQLLSTQKNIHGLHQSDILNNNFINKTDAIDEDILAYSYMEHTPKINEMSNQNNGHFGFFATPYLYNNFIGSETFSDNLMLEETIQQHYQYPTNYKKY